MVHGGDQPFRIAARSLVSKSLSITGRSAPEKIPVIRRNIMAWEQTIIITAIAFILNTVGITSSFGDQIQVNVPVKAPINTESAAKGGAIAIKSVFRIICAAQDSMGTGFLHKSGNVLTAAHVVKNCQSPKIMRDDGSLASARVIASDSDIDIAIISPTFPIEEPALTVSNKSDFRVGTQVSTWGYPGGYTGLSPMLSVGYISGLQGVKIDKKIVAQLVINAAFNRGNSGGPLIDIESGDVIGIVSSKVAQISPDAEAALAVLQQNSTGLIFSAKRQDGKEIRYSESQIIAMVLDDLQKQVQLVIGNAVQIEDVRIFLSSQNIDP